MNESKTLSPTKLNGLVKKILHHHTACLTAFGDALRHAFECGRLLNEAKQTLPRGEYERWVHKNFDFGDRTAQLYKRVFENWPVLKSKAEDMATLSLSQANKLLTAPKSKPAPEVDPDDDEEPQSVPTAAENRAAAVDASVAPAPEVVQKPAKSVGKPHDTLLKLMKKYDLFGEPEMLIELLLALGFAKAEVESKLAQEQKSAS